MAFKPQDLSPPPLDLVVIQHLPSEARAKIHVPVVADKGDPNPHWNRRRKLGFVAIVCR